MALQLLVAVTFGGFQLLRLPYVSQHVGALIFRQLIGMIIRPKINQRSPTLFWPARVRTSFKRQHRSLKYIMGQSSYEHRLPGLSIAMGQGISCANTVAISSLGLRTWVVQCVLSLSNGIAIQTSHGGGNEGSAGTAGVEVRFGA